MYKVNNVNDLELVYSILRDENPTKQIDITFNYNTKEYFIELTNKKYISDPEVPLDLTIEVIYGDSVTGDTPLLLRKNNSVYIETIQSIFDENKKIDYPEFKLFDKTESIKLEKEYSTTNYQIWSNNGWTNINKVIRHKTDKKIYKILTHTGCVKVTEDHSLLNENNEIIKPLECNIGTKLLTSYPICDDVAENNVSKDKAFIYGFFYGDGSCDRYECPSGIKYSWALNNSDMAILNNLKERLQKEYPNSKPIIYDTIESSGVYKLSINNQKNMVEEYRHKFYDSERYKKVPTEILNSDLEIIQSFFDGYWAADGCRKDKENIGCTRFDNKGQIGSAGLYYLMKKLGYDVSLNTRIDKEKMLRISITKQKQRKLSNEIKKIELLDTDPNTKFVYDIETECGRFQAGVGDIIVKNTDSIFIRFKYNREDFDKNRLDTFRLATLCGAKLTNEIFKRPPIEMEFEKVFQPFVLLTKKRYIAKKFENPKDPFQLKGIDAKGIALTRRDYCNMVKKCYKQIIDTIMDSDPDTQKLIDKSIEEFKVYIDKIERYDLEMEDLVISAQIAKEYSCKHCKKKVEWVIRCSCKTLNPSKLEKCLKCKKSFECLHSFSLAHINLAQNMLRRNEEIQIGDRLSYAFVESEDKKAQKFDLAEDPKYIKENSLKINRLCYLEQLAKPILALYKIVLKDNSDVLDDLIHHVNTRMILFGGKAFKLSDFKLEE